MAFSYSEKGVKDHGKPTIVFVHGLSSNKETWIPIIKVSKDDRIISFVSNLIYFNISLDPFCFM